MPFGFDAKEVMDLALVPGRGGHERGEGGVARLGRGQHGLGHLQPARPRHQRLQHGGPVGPALATSPAKRPPATTCAATDSARWSGSIRVAKAALVVTIPSRAHERRG